MRRFFVGCTIFHSRCVWFFVVLLWIPIRALSWCVAFFSNLFTHNKSMQIALIRASMPLRCARLVSVFTCVSMRRNNQYPYLSLIDGILIAPRKLFLILSFISNCFLLLTHPLISGKKVKYAHCQGIAVSWEIKIQDNFRHSEKGWILLLICLLNDNLKKFAKE